MKIISSILENIEGIQMYYIIGLIIFIVLFINIVIHTFKTPTEELDTVKNYVFDSEEEKT